MIATGQKDLRTRRTGTIFFKVLDGLQLQETDHRGAVEFLRGQDPAAAKDAALRRVKALMRIHGIGIDELT